MLFRDRIDVADPAQGVGIVASGFDSFEDDGLVTAQASAFVDRTRAAPFVVEIFLGASHEERRAACEDRQVPKIDVAAIDHVEGARFQEQMIEGVDIVGFSVRYADKTRNIATQVDHGMQLDGTFAPTKFRPGE